jgi:hypothetical protein
MKQVLVLTLLFVATSSGTTYAQTLIPRHEVFEAANAMLDPVAIVPNTFKPIEKDMRAYRVARQQYTDVAEKSYEYVLDAGAISITSSQDFSAIADGLDSRIRQLNHITQTKKDLLKRMQSTQQGKSLWLSIVEARPEYNDVQSAPYDERYHRAIIKLLTGMRDGYRALAQMQTVPLFANGSVYFTTEGQTYIYLRLLASMRQPAYDMVASERDKYEFLLKQSGILSLYGNEYVAGLENKIKEKNAILENWTRTSALPEGAYTPLMFFLRTNKALREDEKTFSIKRNIDTQRIQTGWSPAFQKNDFATAASLQAAAGKAQTIATLIEEYQQVVRMISIRMAKEIREQYNINRAIINASNSEFSAFFDASILAPYTHGLIAYQHNVYATVRPCLSLSGKKKCTVQIKDAITISVNDKKTQKTLDALKAAFLKTYKSDYDRLQNTIPSIGI